VSREAEIVEYLSKKGIPTTRFYKTVSGEYSFICNNRIVCLEEFIDGTSYGYDDLPEHLLPKVASMLGKLHFCLRDYVLPGGMGMQWCEEYSSDKLISQYGELIALVGNDRNAERIISDLEYKTGLAERINEYKKHFEGITYIASHGDYQGCQLIFEGNEIKAVIDFSSARTLPAVWEIMRSFTQTSQKCRESATIDVTDFRSYVAEYMKNSSLTRSDITAMPYVYLFQLARSKFGYTQYLKSDSEDREGLLKFAFWRTDICRELERKAYDISKALTTLI
jgi:Ser/Thr protein kinase RdoA (MazF antagonist)